MIDSRWKQQSDNEIKQAKQVVQRRKEMDTERVEFASFVENCYEPLEDVGKRLHSIGGTNGKR